MGSSWVWFPSLPKSAIHLPNVANLVHAWCYLIWLRNGTDIVTHTDTIAHTHTQWWVEKKKNRERERQIDVVCGWDKLLVGLCVTWSMSTAHAWLQAVTNYWGRRMRRTLCARLMRLAPRALTLQQRRSKNRHSPQLMRWHTVACSFQWQKQRSISYTILCELRWATQPENNDL